jgi:hypothetical protein
MKVIKYFLYLPVLLAMMGIAIGQNNDSPTERVILEEFERCNNWSRHYCQSGDHEQIVNKELALWKAKGILITSGRIRLLAQKIRQNLKLPKQQKNLKRKQDEYYQKNRRDKN